MGLFRNRLSAGLRNDMVLPLIRSGSGNNLEIE